MPPDANRWPCLWLTARMADRTASVAQTQAERYDVQVDIEVADRAKSLLQEMQAGAGAA